MPPLEELVQKNRAKITTREAAINTDANKTHFEEATEETGQRYQQEQPHLCRGTPK